MNNSNNPINIIGIGQLINQNNADETCDYEQLERTLLEGYTDTNTKIDITSDFDRALKKISALSPIDTNSSYKYPSPSKGDKGDKNDRTDIDIESIILDSSDKSERNDDSLDALIDMFDKPSSSVSNFGNFGNAGINGSGGGASSSRNVGFNLPMSSNITDEERKQKDIDSVMSTIGKRGIMDFSLEKERMEDDKAILLEEIDLMRATLQEDGIDISRIPDVNRNSSYDEVKSIHGIYRIKNDRARYCGLAEECIMTGAHAAGWIFDGEKTYFGTRPNLVGWHNTVRTKLRRMRFDTSTVVGNVMQNYNLGPLTRILLELVPSAILDSWRNKSDYGKGLYHTSNDDVNDAFDQLDRINHQND